MTFSDFLHFSTNTSEFNKSKLLEMEIQTMDTNTKRQKIIFLYVLDNPNTNKANINIIKLENKEKIFYYRYLFSNLI